MRYILVSVSVAFLCGHPRYSSAFVKCFTKTVPSLHRKNALSTTSRSRLCKRWSSAVAVNETPIEDVSSPDVKSLSDLTVGGEYQGVVTNVVSYGIFVDVGADINGLVHISQISDAFISSPEEIVTVGDVISVKVLSVDNDAKKLELSMRHNPKKLIPFQTEDLTPYISSLSEDPARLIDGTVDHIIKHGAFIKLAHGGYGFLHISQMRPNTERVAEVTDVLSIGQTTQVRLLNVDTNRKRMNVSLLPISETSGNKSVKDVSSMVNVDKNIFIPGIVASVHEYGVFINVNGVDGLLHTSKIEERTKFTIEQLQERFKVGETVNVRVLHVDAVANKLSLTILPYPAKPDLSKFAAMSPDEWIEGTVVSTVEYGAFVQLGDGVDGMIHISELGNSRLNSVTDAVKIGDNVRVRVIDVQPEERKVRLSMKDPSIASSIPSNPSRKIKNVEKYATVSPDEWIDGRVQSFTDFGAFIRLDKRTDGLLHLSQMKNDAHVENAEDVLSLNQDVKVRVINVDIEAGRISLSMREPRAAPSEDSSEQRSQSGGGRRRSRDVTQFMNTDPNTFVNGKVTSLLPYGCFVELENSGGIQGLLHISQLSEERIELVEDVVREGDIVSVRIIEVNPEAGKISLSMLAPGSAKNAQRGERNSSGNEEFGGDDDDESGGGRRKSPRPRFNDLTYLDNDESSTGEKDWHKYLNNYFDKKE